MPDPTNERTRYLVLGGVITAILILGWRLHPWRLLTTEDLVGYAIILTGAVVVLGVPAYIIWQLHQLKRAVAFLIFRLGMPAPPERGKVVDIKQRSG
jgi:hypothetical protein